MYSDRIKECDKTLDSFLQTYQSRQNSLRNVRVLIDRGDQLLSVVNRRDYGCLATAIVVMRKKKEMYLREIELAKAGMQDVYAKKQRELERLREGKPYEQPVLSLEAISEDEPDEPVTNAAQEDYRRKTAVRRDRIRNCLTSCGVKFQIMRGLLRQGFTVIEAAAAYRIDQLFAAYKKNP